MDIRKKIVIVSIIYLCVLLLPFFINMQEHKYLMDIFLHLNLALTLANSWNILGGFAGQVSFGHAGFVGIGAYTVALLVHYLKLSCWTALLFSGFFSCCIALFLGLLTLKLRGPYFALATLATAEIAKIIVVGARSFTMGTQGVAVEKTPLLGSENYLVFLFLFALMLSFISIISSLLIRYSKTGYFFIAIRESENATMAAGINVFKYKVIALLISGYLAGAYGGILAIHTGFVDPESAFDISRTVEPIFISYIGGVGTVIGPIIGSLLLVPIGEVLRTEFTTAHLLFYGIMLILFATFFPKGLAGLIKLGARKNVAKNK
ncbi:MAG: branched-chain amino acid ABC transporter permease [Thermodesulfovibrio sp.]|nr:branched-chain amino acid ABC transporter permease [Thermodesulfovibrio sp.]